MTWVDVRFFKVFGGIDRFSYYFLLGVFRDY